MSQQLPPLNALRAFEAVARHLSFTKAAVELNVTRAAISHQIKFLEDYLGFTLLERKNRTITLSQGAEEALPKLREGFDNLAEAVHLMRSEKHRQSITVFTTPSFASKWLIPRLHRFSLKHPDIDMQINSNVHLMAADLQGDGGGMDTFFRQNHVDVVIGFGAGQLAGAEKLFAVSAVPVCSPTLVSKTHHHPLKQPEDLAFHTLLHDESDYIGHPSWITWLKRQGVQGVNVNRGLHFNHVSLALDAAVDGQGVLLAIKPLAQSDIDAGRLCIPFNLPIQLEHAYFIFRQKKNNNNQVGTNVFVEWLREEAQLQSREASKG
ncbi:transcriptional regulator GcvA [Thiothrix fructosivorans]|uniref:Transcriptional regulator GcvA n=1 Tax=Thiothrix fructosivorans TaxID=111770 RepID=A0A8B0SJJ8_9GAMM|nr:transcriptional regulator GcvA [Thiothrix fructosivorans]MBO0613382.1 transcriptional regulator GcvA [Thiothrix fructosivorans]QTX11184.1 transcriptional regulator GcvA [Thiothrix fructosivorans]